MLPSNKQKKSKKKSIGFLTFFHKKKKGSSILLIIFEILAIILVIATMFSVANRFAEDSSTQKVFHAEEIRMLVNTFVGLPGDSEIIYPKNVSEYVFILSDTQITVYGKGEKDNTLKKVRRIIHLPEGYTAAGTSNLKDKICLEKKSKRIFLHDC